MDYEPDLEGITELPSWRDEAACRGMDSEVFFAEQRGRSTREARAVCAECPVSELCLEYALDRPEKMGVWGGTVPKEREAIRARRRRQRRVAREEH